jgi:hypothetical protein
VSYIAFLIAFSAAGLVLLVGLFVDDSMEENRSSARLQKIKGDLKSLDTSERTLSETRGEEIAIATRRAMRRLAEDPERERRRDEESGLKPESRDAVVRMLRDAFVPREMERRKFPLRAYVSADSETKRSIRLALTVLRVMREAARAGVHVR